MRRASLLLALLLLASRASAQLDPFRLGGNPDPLRLGTLPFEPAEASILARHSWQVSVATGYFNLWLASPEVAGVRRDLGLGRETVTAEHLREAERRFPNRDLYLIDVEGWRTDVLVSYGIGAGATLTLHVPWVEIGAPHWDGVAEWWHERLGFPNANRGLFPRGDTLVYLRSSDTTVERRDLAGSGLADASITLAAPLGRLLGAEHRLVLGAQAPTGPHDTLRGSGGWDLGVRWYAAWRGARGAVITGAGYTRPASNGDLLGTKRGEVWHLFGGADLRLWRHTYATYRVQWERSPLAGVIGGQAGEHSLFQRFGVLTPLSSAGWLAFELGQDWTNAGPAPDYSFHLTFARTITPRR
jgi:hypothetical protein